MKERDRIRFRVFLSSIALHSVLATCDRLRTACGIIKDKRLKGIGYNGSVAGLPHCDDKGHLIVENHCLNTRHGEVNAISNTSREDLKGGQAIVIATPCLECIKDLTQEGVKEIHYIGSYPNSIGATHIKKITKGRKITLKKHEVDWAEVFQEMFDLLARKGGILEREGYRLKVTKEKIK